MPKSPERADEYESFYREFDSPLMRQIRLEAYGEDIGQHSWVSADELRGDAVRLGLNKRSGLLDLGSGPCGPLTFLISHSGCTGVGLELSPSAIEVGRSRAVALGDIRNSVCHGRDRFAALPRGARRAHVLPLRRHVSRRGRPQRAVASRSRAVR